MFKPIEKILRFFRYPEPGQRFIYRTKNPFDPGHEVEIIAAKAGFVNYKMLSGSMFQNESMTHFLFRSIYKENRYTGYRSIRPCD